MKKVLRSVVLVVGLGVVLTSCYKGKYEDQLLLNDELVAKNVALNTTISGLNANVVSLNDEINSNNVAIDGLENKITSLGDEINGLIADGNADQGIIDGLNDEIAINEALLDVVRTSLVVLDELAAGIELEIIALNENADVNANEIASLRADLADALELEATLRDRIANDANEIVRLNGVIADLQASLNTANGLLGQQVVADAFALETLQGADGVIISNVGAITKYERGSLTQPDVVNADRTIYQVFLYTNALPGADVWVKTSNIDGSRSSNFFEFDTIAEAVAFFMANGIGNVFVG